MADEYKINLDSAAYYQDNSFLCWASVGLTMNRLKNSKITDLDTFLKQSGGAKWYALYDFISQVEFERGSKGLSLPEAIVAARVSNDDHTYNPPNLHQFTPLGLPPAYANDFYGTFMGLKSIAKDDAKLSTKEFWLGDFKASGSPMVICTQNPSGTGSHVRLIHGTWYHGPTDEHSPQILIWDPEAKIKGKSAFSRLLWSHFVDQIVKKLVAPMFYRPKT